MSKSVNSGLGIVLFAAAMAVSGSASATPSFPTCTQANWGEIFTTYTQRPNGGYVQRIFECSSSGWTVIGMYNEHGCINY